MCYHPMFLLSLCFLGLSGQFNTISAEFTERKLKEFVEKKVENGLIVLTEPVLYTKDKVLYYNLGGWENAAMDHDPYSIPLKAQCRLEVIPHHPILMLSIKKWFPIRTAIEEVIDKMLADITSGIYNSKEIYPRLHDYNNRVDALFDKYIHIVAKDNGLLQPTFVPPPPPQMTRIDLHTNPQGGSIRYFTAGNWSLYQLRQKTEKNPRMPEPKKIEELEEIPSGSTYQFFVSWPNGDAYEGIKTITDKTMITFQPSDIASRRM